MLRRGIEAHLRAHQGAVLEELRRHHDGPAFVLAQLGALEVIGEEQFLLLRDRLRGNRGQLRRIGGEGGGGDEEAEIHVGWGNGRYSKCHSAKAGNVPSMRIIRSGIFFVSYF